MTRGRAAGRTFVDSTPLMAHTRVELFQLRLGAVVDLLTESRQRRWTSTFADMALPVVESARVDSA